MTELVAAAAAVAAAAGAVACGSSSRHQLTAPELVAFVDGTSVFGPAREFVTSDLSDVRATGLFPARPAGDCGVAVLAGGEDSFAVRMQLLARARRTIRIQALTQPAGVELWEWQGKAPGDARQTQGLYHAKFAVIDRELALVGSYNLDPRSEHHNSETAIVFASRALAEQLAALHAHDLTTSRQVGADEAAGFEQPASLRKRLGKDLADVFEDLM